jgi:cytochrome P450
VGSVATVDVISRLREPENLVDPYPLYAALREMRTTTPRGEVVLARYDDVTAVLADGRFGKVQGPRTTWKSGRAAMRMFLLLDPPDHTRLRRVVAPAFTPSAVDALRPMVTDVASALVPPGAGEIDLVADFAYPLPLTVICELLGVPKTDRPQFAEWSRALTASLDEPLPIRLRDVGATVRDAISGRTHPMTTVRTLNGMVGYARDALARAVADPPSDVVARIGHASRAGEMSDDEAVATWILLTIAGHETTANLIGNGMLALLQQPEALAELTGDPTRIAGAVDELLRYETPVPHTPRVAREQVSIGGCDFEPGQMALVLMAAANRDPDAFPEPNRLRFDRPKAPPHVGFAHGIHFCAGAALARLEASVAFATILPRLDATQDVTRARRRDTVAVRGLDHFPIRLRAA